MEKPEPVAGTTNKSLVISGNDLTNLVRRDQAPGSTTADSTNTDCPSLPLIFV